jgi:ligand-binding sensor domain-containing protein
MVLFTWEGSVRPAGLITLVIIVAAAGVIYGAGGEWNVYLNPSAINRISVTGDSLWCATTGGILLFDLSDSSFTQYIDGLDFRSSDVSAVTVDRHGGIWAGFTSSGVTRIDDINTEPFVKHYSETLEGILSDSITCFAVVGDDVYYGSANGVAKFYEHVPVDEFVLTDSLEGKRVNDLLISGDTILWAACEDGVAAFNRRSAAFQRYSIGGSQSLCEHDGLIYSAGDGGIWKFNGDQWSIVVDLLSGNAPVAIASGGGELVCVTMEDVYRWNGFVFAGLDAGDFKDLILEEYYIGWNRFTISTVVVDDGGVPWVGGEFTDGARGAYLTYYHDSQWRNRAPVLLSQSGIIEIEAAPAGGVWVSTRYFGVNYKSKYDEWISYTDWRNRVGENALSYYLNNLVLLYDSRGYLWCATIGFDLDRIEINEPLIKSDDQWIHMTPGVDPVTTNTFIKGKDDPAGNRWFLMDEQVGVINIISADGSDSLAVTVGSGRVVDCAFGAFGKVFLAISGFGVQTWRTWGFDWGHLKDTDDDVWPEPIIETNKDLWAIASDDTSTWVGTSNGVIRYRDGLVDSIPRKNKIGETGLIGAEVKDLEYDSSGNLWVATDEGLNKITRDGGIEAFTTAEHWRESPDLQFMYPNSIISPLPASVCNALEYDPDENVLWIGTSNGLARLDVSSPEKVDIPLSDLFLYPNPVHLSRGDAVLRIGRISDPVAIRVYSMEGELVHEVSNVSDGGVAWDLLTLNGFKAVSGVYVVRVSAPGGDEVRKVAVVR